MLPEKFINRMKCDLKDDFDAFLASYEKEPEKSLRINGLKHRINGNTDLKDLFSLERVEWCENGFYFSSGEDSQPGKHAFHEAGLYYIQEASAMAPVRWLDVRPGMRVLDIGAAPGGKSTEIAEALNNTGLLVANEPVKDRAKILSLNIERLGIMNTLVTNELPEKLSGSFEAFFDRILVDAPCSGEGMFRKNPEAVNEWSGENVRMCAERQAYILDEAAKMLRPGGIMVYSTCTFSKDENEGIVAGFLSKEKDFRLLDPESIKKLPEGFIKQETGVRIYPHKVRGEGHFFAVLERMGRTGEKSAKYLKTGTLKEASAPDIKLFSLFCDENLKDFRLPEGVIHSFGDQLYFSLPEMPGIRGLKVLRPGLHLGTVKNKRFEPSHALALYLSPDSAGINAETADHDTALRFLRGETLPAELAGNKKGWCIVSYDGCSLGWGKSDGRIIKNHYPKGKRIIY